MIYNEYKTTILGVQEVAYGDVKNYRIVDGKHIANGVYKAVYYYFRNIYLDCKTKNKLNEDANK